MSQIIRHSQTWVSSSAKNVHWRFWKASVSGMVTLYWAAAKAEPRFSDVRDDPAHRLMPTFHQTVNFCCGSTCLLHDNCVLAPLKTANFWKWVPEFNLLKVQPSLWLCLLAKQKACERGDRANANASASQCILQQQLPNSDQKIHSAPKASWTWW